MKRKAMLKIATLVVGAAAILLVALSWSLPVKGSCAHCHAKAVASVEKGAHGNLSCAVCHQGPGAFARMRFGWTMITGMYTHITDPSQGSLSTTSQTQCTRSDCHVVSELPVATTGGLRISHKNCTDGLRCVQCHPNVAHEEKSIRNSVDMFNCLTCHRNQGVSVDCNLCHDGRVQPRIPTATFSVTHGKQWKNTHGLGNMAACDVCHQNKTCAGCHGAGVPHTVNYLRTHGSDAKSSTARCSSVNGCHEQSFCDTCHKGFELPHPQSFVKTHSALVKKEGDKRCANCHDPKDCTQCHERHVHPGGAVNLKKVQTP
ncbi:MAG: hypothetical protein FWD65_04040 [Coriobacteriia bacterium]|nr:hypothetical protein [Coriobacteriia bacterium]